MHSRDTKTDKNLFCFIGTLSTTSEKPFRGVVTKFLLLSLLQAKVTPIKCPVKLGRFKQPKVLQGPFS